jgi:hypothetical protein
MEPSLDRFRCYCAVCKKYIPKSGATDWFIAYPSSDRGNKKLVTFACKCHGKSAQLKLDMNKVDDLPLVCIAFSEELNKEEIKSLNDRIDDL